MSTGNTSTNSGRSSRPAADQSQPPPQAQDLSASEITIPSDSEAFSSLSIPSASASPPQSSSNKNDKNNTNTNSKNKDDGNQDQNKKRQEQQNVVLYTKPTFWSLVRGAAINLLLPFVNGMMLGLGELLAHEIAFRWGWGTTQIFPKHRASSSSSRTVGPGMEMREDPVERRRRKGEIDPDLLNTTALE